MQRCSIHARNDTIVVLADNLLDHARCGREHAPEWTHHVVICHAALFVHLMDLRDEAAVLRTNAHVLGMIRQISLQ